MKQKSIGNTDLKKLDEEANKFEIENDVKFTQSYCGLNENGALVHVRVLFYNPLKDGKKQNPLDLIDAKEKEIKKTFPGIKMGVVDTTETDIDGLDELDDLEEMVPTQEEPEKDMATVAQDAEDKANKEAAESKMTMEELDELSELDDM